MSLLLDSAAAKLTTATASYSILLDLEQLTPEPTTIAASSLYVMADNATVAANQTTLYTALTLELLLLLLLLAAALQTLLTELLANGGTSATTSGALLSILILFSMFGSVWT